MDHVTGSHDAVTRRYSIVIGAFVLCFIALRVWRLTDACLWFDEIFGVHAAGHTWREMWWFVGQDLVHPPLFYGLFKVWTAIGGESLLWVRLFPVLFAVVALIPFFQLTRELKLSRLSICIALGLFAFNGSLIKYAQEVRMYSLFMCIGLCSLWVFSRFYYRGKNIWVLTAVNILLVYTHYFGWLIVVSELLVILVMQRIKIRHVLMMTGIAAVSFLPWLWTLWEASAIGSDIRQNIAWMDRPGPREVAGLVFDLLEPIYFQASSAEPSTLLWASIPFVVLFIVAMAGYLTEKPRDASERLILLAGLAGIPVLLAFVASWLSPYSVWGSRHLVVVIAPILIIFSIYTGEIKTIALRNMIICVLAIVSIATLARTVMTVPAEPIWCAWETSVRSTELEGATIYAFEDLAAYHLWFATRGRNVHVIKVDGLPGISEDTAYFLPRGTQAVERRQAGEIDAISSSAFFSFRDTAWHERHLPIEFFRGKGYEVREVFASEASQGTRVFLGEASR